MTPPLFSSARIWRNDCAQAGATRVSVCVSEEFAPEEFGATLSALFPAGLVIGSGRGDSAEAAFEAARQDFERHHESVAKQGRKR